MVKKHYENKPMPSSCDQSQRGREKEKGEAKEDLLVIEAKKKK